MTNDNQFNMIFNTSTFSEQSVSRDSFGGVDKKNDAGEPENNEEDEKDVWHDGSELSIEDFKATGEDLDDYDDNLDIDDHDFNSSIDKNSISQEELDLFDMSETDKVEKNIHLDSTDAEGVLLNEEDDESGDDLDVPGAELDDEEEEIGEEDEENNEFTQNKQND